MSQNYNFVQEDINQIFFLLTLNIYIYYNIQYLLILKIRQLRLNFCS